MPDLTREEVEAARKDHLGPALLIVERLEHDAQLGRQSPLDEQDDTGWQSDLAAAFGTLRDAVRAGVQIADQALRQMEEIGRLRADRDHWRGVVVEVQSDAAVAESNCDALTADLAAARAAIERVEALAKEWEGTANMFDARTMGGSAAGNTIRKMVDELRAALRGEGAKDA